MCKLDVVRWLRVKQRKTVTVTATVVSILVVTRVLSVMGWTRRVFRASSSHRRSSAVTHTIKKHLKLK